ncbi:MAG: LysE family translocator [Roseitalea sp.]|jgi:threonine/homoserine/homoserine lactone efflux protein|nr:LysE family translocator [Roseitalea sp.]MBO6721935.1 LysE family translocator [Roseitalea sp.]MBO6743106.1 LysE family translocator [Roseitalea sp.]
MTLPDFLTYAVALAIAAAIPGPGVIAIVARALGAGLRPTLPMLLGLVLGDVIYLAAAILGLAYAASTFGSVFIVIKYAGVAYLVWMAIGFWRAGVTPEAIDAKADSGGALSGFMAGLLVTLGNPKTMVFYLALLPTLIDMTVVTMADFTILIGVTFAVLVTVLLPYAGLAGRARIFLRTPRALKALNRFAATCLGGAAVAIAARAS